METHDEKGGSVRSGKASARSQKRRDVPGHTSATGSKESRGGTKEPHENFLGENGVNKNRFLTALGVVAGGVLLYKGARALKDSGKIAKARNAVLEIKTSQVIKRPKEDLYAYWRNLENLPIFMSHIQEVEELDTTRSHWVVEVPGGLGHIQWEAEIVWDQENQLIAWRSLPDSEIENSGEVRFQDAGNRKSTLVEARISYRPPMGKAGKMASKLLNPAFKKVVETDLKEFKKIMERGARSRGKTSLASRM